jgi:hypothetical protein
MLRCTTFSEFNMLPPYPTEHDGANRLVRALETLHRLLIGSDRVPPAKANRLHAHDLIARMSRNDHRIATDLRMAMDRADQSV